MSGKSSLRVLIACPTCHLQHDASALAQGTRFHCSCGEVLEVEQPQPHDAAVVRCSSCGAPRQSAASECSFCGSDFTLLEKDLHTICPVCATRISNRARFCHSCATPISPQTVAGSKTSRLCPACDTDRALHSRPVDGEKVAILECHQCAGIWIGHDVFRYLEETALAREIGWNPSRADGGNATVVVPKAGDRLYRRCPECSQLMNRTNYGRRSGVIVDVCGEHGVWFDHGELARILEWIRDGNWTEAQRKRILEDAEMEAARRAAATPSRSTMSIPAYRTSTPTFGRLLVSVIEALFAR